MKTLRRITAGVQGVRLIDPMDAFCTASQCRPYEGETVYFKDDNHLSPAGAERFYREFQGDMEWALVGQESRTEGR
jgi:hypothetical protein